MSEEINNCSQFNNASFQEVWPTDDSFLADMNSDNGIPVLITQENLTVLYFLLLSKYANNILANSSIEQFKYKVRAIIWQYGPTWEKRLSIQSELRNLSEDDLRTGSKAIYNKALAPGGSPTTSSLEEVDFINEQNTQSFKKGKLEGYSFLLNLLSIDVTEQFLSKFKKLFNFFALPDKEVEYCYGGLEDDTVRL